jgi:hypothetical protein
MSPLTKTSFDPRLLNCELCQIPCFCTKLCRRGIAAYWHAVAEDCPDGAVQCQVLPHGGCLPRGPGKYLIQRLFLLILSLFVISYKIFVSVMYVKKSDQRHRLNVELDLQSLFGLSL